MTWFQRLVSLFGNLRLRRSLCIATMARILATRAEAAPATQFANPTNIFVPVSDPADSIFSLSVFVLFVTAIFLVVFTLLTYWPREIPQKAK